MSATSLRQGTTTAASLGHVLGRVEAVTLRLGAALEERERSLSGGGAGLFLSAGDARRGLETLSPIPVCPAADDLVVAAEATADGAEENGSPTRLRGLKATFGLDDLDVDLLICALAPEVDGRLEAVFGVLHDDLRRRRASAGLALSLAGRDLADVTARDRLQAGRALVDGGLIVVEDDDRPFLSRSLRVPDRVTAHLLGGDAPDPLVVPWLAQGLAVSTGDPEALARAMRQGASVVYLHEPPGDNGRALACEAFGALGVPAVPLDLTDLDAATSADELAALLVAAVREARLAGAGLVVGPVEVLAGRGPCLVRNLVAASWPMVLTGHDAWDPSWARDVPLVVDVPPLTAADREGLWRDLLDHEDPAGPGSGEQVSSDLPAAVASYVLGPDQINRAVTAALHRARYKGRPVELEDLRTGARLQNSSRLEQLAVRVEPSAGWSDLVLPEPELDLLSELATRARLRSTVLDAWDMREGGRRGNGIAALFAGPPGTGKTLSAEVIAGSLGLDLYTVELSTVVDKYIGETEKNLQRIFEEASRVNGVLFFDEADALFGKRSEVRSAHDRYANVETAYLLQRLESFGGITVLATNLRANIDEAFARRLDIIVEFPLPDEAHRLRLWERSLRPGVPHDPDLDFEFCARAFELSGGSIRSICVAAAYFGAEESACVAMRHVIRATKREYRKLGRLTHEAEFGAYAYLL